MDSSAKASHVRNSYRRLGQFQRRQIRLEILRRAAEELDPLQIGEVHTNKKVKKSNKTATKNSRTENAGTYENVEMDENAGRDEDAEADANSPKFVSVGPSTPEPSFHVFAETNYAENSDEDCKGTLTEDPIGGIDPSHENDKETQRQDGSPLPLSPSTKMEMSDTSGIPDHLHLANADQSEIAIIPVLNGLLNAVREMQYESRRQFRDINRRLGNMEDLLARELSSEFPAKPDCLPLRTKIDLANFEKIQIDEYTRVVDYLGRLSSGNLNETCVTVFKAAFSDSLAPQVTTHGVGEGGNAKLDGTRFLRALYAAVAKNRSYEKPTWKHFLDLITNALRATKQRLRRAQVSTVKQ